MGWGVKDRGGGGVGELINLFFREEQHKGKDCGIGMNVTAEADN